MDTKFRWDGRIVKFIELLIDLLLVVLGFGVVIQLGGQININLATLNFYEIRDLLVSSLELYSRMQQRGVLTDFNKDTFDTEYGSAKSRPSLHS